MTIPTEAIEAAKTALKSCEDFTEEVAETLLDSWAETISNIVLTAALPCLKSELTTEYRAVFSFPPSHLGTSSDEYGPWRETLKEAQRDYVPRREENLGWVSGFQQRSVSPIRIVEGSNQ